MRLPPIRLPAVPLPTILLLAIFAWPGPAASEVRRCVMPGGDVVHTDRSCSSLGAVEQSRRHDDAPVSTHLYYGRCAATLPDLLYEVTNAIDGRDVNRLAASYHWPGLSGNAANATMDRLDAIAARPLLDVRIVTRDIPGAPVDPLAVGAAPAADARVAPTGLRVEQLREDGTTPVTTQFSLRRHLDCWWVRL